MELFRQKRPVGHAPGAPYTSLLDEFSAAELEEQIPKEPHATLFSSILNRLRLCLMFGAISSPIIAAIYYPLPSLPQGPSGIVAQAITLALTLFLLGATISPVLFGSRSDNHGRRFFFLLALAIYIIGTIGLKARDHGYSALIILRMIQPLAASAAYAIGFGVIANVWSPSCRGKVLGLLGVALNLGACVGPGLGVAMAYRSAGRVWMFWAIIFLGVVAFCVPGLFLAETAKDLVDNNFRTRQSRWWRNSGVALIKAKLQENDAKSKSNSSFDDRTKHQAKSTSMTTLWTCLTLPRLGFHRDAFCTIWLHLSLYLVDYSYDAVLPELYQENGYELFALHLSPAYLPRLVGIILGSYLTGKLMDHNYNDTLQTLHSAPTTRTVRSSFDLRDFPIEVARCRYVDYVLLVSTATTIAYGWALTSHPGVALILQFMQGMSGTHIYITTAALLADVFPEKPTSAAAVTSVARCITAAIGLTVLQPLLNTVGRPEYFKALGLWSGISGVLAVWLLRKRGMEWRRERTTRC